MSFAGVELRLSSSRELPCSSRLSLALLLFEQRRSHQNGHVHLQKPGRESNACESESSELPSCEGGRILLPPFVALEDLRVVASFLKRSMS